MAGTYSSVAEVRALLHQRFPAEYARKMLHSVPVWPSIKERAEVLLPAVTGKAILDIGCTGKLSERLKAAASTYHGLDKYHGHAITLDLDTQPDELPVVPVDVVVCSEVLEHLANPGRFLAALAKAYPTHDTYFSVPHAGAFTMHHGCEMVNLDHVAWYSYTTLTTLLSRYTYTVRAAWWYNGLPHRAEGLLVHARVEWPNDSSKDSPITT